MFRAEYERASAEIAQIDAVLRTLDHLREKAGMSKAEIARRIGQNPASVRRLFTAQVNPELKTIAALAYALNAEVRIVARANTSQARGGALRTAGGRNRDSPRGPRT